MSWEVRATIQQAETVTSPTRVQSHSTRELVTRLVTLTPSVHSLICTVRQTQGDESCLRSNQEAQPVNQDQQKSGRTQLFLCHSSGRNWGPELKWSSRTKEQRYVGRVPKWGCPGLLRPVSILRAWKWVSASLQWCLSPLLYKMS